MSYLPHQNQKELNGKCFWDEKSDWKGYTKQIKTNQVLEEWLKW
jgi:hypothetical protein